ncbi:MAG: tRNA 2-thiouridine(34) synthase MnmA [Chloroflexota bacterium]
MGRRVAVALSGGGDSALAAQMLREAGHDVFALHAIFTPSADTAAQVDAAQSVARHLDLDLHTIDLSEQFTSAVIEPFCTAYASGRTPNPCVLCNASIKFGALLRIALDSGADLLATGHYARVVTDENGTRLLRALDRRADQSYFLYRVRSCTLSLTLMPLGEMSRTEVHSRVRTGGLPVGRPSKDLCFVHDHTYHRFVASRSSSSPGEIVDNTGRVLGRHKGLAFYTVGQRHGLDLALGYPAYVTRLVPEANRIVVGPENELYAGSAAVTDLSWVSGVSPGDIFRAGVQVRYRAKTVPADIKVQGRSAHVAFAQPQKAVAPGQSLVVYNGETVLGGGILQAAY